MVRSAGTTQQPTLYSFMLHLACGCGTLMARPSQALRIGSARMVSFEAAAQAVLWAGASGACAFTAAESELFAHGWLAKDAPLLVAPSRVPNAGRGVFATQDLAAGVTLGTYPGRLLRSASYYAKRERVPHFCEYCWVIQELQIALDPTDDTTGVLCEPLPRFGPAGSLLGSIETTLALINEPPPSADVNLVTAQEGKTIRISTSRDITEGEELYLDCETSSVVSLNAACAHKPLALPLDCCHKSPKTQPRTPRNG